MAEGAAHGVEEHQVAGRSLVFSTALRFLGPGLLVGPARGGQQAQLISKMWRVKPLQSKAVLDGCRPRIAHTPSSWPTAPIPRAVSRLPSSQAGALSGAGTRPRSVQKRVTASLAAERLGLPLPPAPAAAGWRRRSPSSCRAAVPVGSRSPAPRLAPARPAPGRGPGQAQGQQRKGAGESAKQASIRADSEVTASFYIGRAG